MYHADIRATDAGAPDILPGHPTVKTLDRSQAANSRRLAVLITAVALALLSCKKDATSPAAAATKLAFTVQPSDALVDSSIVPAIAVTVEDASGNPVTASNALVTVSISANPGGANLSGTATIVAVAGIATFPYLALNRAGTGYTLTASATNLTGATSASFNVLSVTNGLFSSVSTGGNGTCGLSTTGQAYCWGDNSFGQLGNGSNSGSTIPVRVSGGLTFRSVSNGSLDLFACGLTTSGSAWCWGLNEYGELGNGTSGSNHNSSVPVAVVGGLTFTSLSAGPGGHACGVAVGGAAYCWGYNSSGQLGTGSLVTSSSPVPVSGGLSFASLSAGQNWQTCGVAIGGAAYCWGNNGSGRLGNGSTTNSNTPVPVSGGLIFANVSTGFNSTCGLTVTGAAYCWGDNTYGELGTGSTTNSNVPVAVSGGLKFGSVSVGDAFACGIATGGTAYCWGYNGEGQLGIGSTTVSLAPVAIAGGLSFSSVSAGYASACAVTPGGAAYCWGNNQHGELGNQSTVQSLRPVLVVTPQ